MTAFFLWDDAAARLFAPFALTRPVGELRAGAQLIRERWERLFGVAAGGFVSAEHLEHFEEPGAPPSAVMVPSGAIIVNARCVPALDAASTLPGLRSADVMKWTCDGRLAALRAPHDLSAHALRELESLEELVAPRSTSSVDPLAAKLPGRWLAAPWDLIASLDLQLLEDVTALAGELDRVARPSHALVMGDHPVVLERGAVVEPLVLLDATSGPILIRRGAVVAALTRLVGPCIVGEGSSVLGGRIASAAIGERCKVHGEVSHAVLVGHSNKAHDGFLGHSYLGRWVNLGAGTITSNLKNTYGPVSLWTPLGMRETGQQFLGTMFGDHSRTAIGTLLSTGTVLGAGANVFGTGMPPRAVEPFAWGHGDPSAVYELERFLVVAERVMARRGVTLGERARRQFAAAYARRAESSGR